MKQEIIKRIEKITSNEHADETEILLQLKNLLYEFEMQNITSRDSKAISELFAESIKALHSDNKFDNVIPTGFANLDNKIGGFSHGELVVIGGRPSMGKTQLLLNLALNISETFPVLYFTFDLSEFLLTNRFISSLSTIPVNKILQHTLSDEEKAKLALLESKMQKHKIFINDSYNNSVSAFRAQCQKQIQENGVKVIIVDYLQMMSSNKYRNNRESEISHISRELKNIAKDNNVCVIAASQLSRAVESRGGVKRPQLADLRESGAIEQDADKVIFIYRPEYYDLDQDEYGNNTAGLTELVIAKNRNGILGIVNLKRDAYFTTYKDFDEYPKNFILSKSRMDEIEES